MRTFRTLTPPRRAVLVGAATCGTLTLGVLPATAGIWQHSSATYVYFQDTCRDGIRFGGAVLPNGQTEPYPATAVAIQPVPERWSRDLPFAMRHDITIPHLAAPELITVREPDPNIPGDTGETAEVGHKGFFTLKYQKPLALGPMALNIEGGNPDSSVTSADVTDCYLFAPIDVQPGSSANRVPIGRGTVKVAVLSTRTLRADRAPSATYRFGPKSAAPTAKAVQDVNRDGRRDLVLTFGSKAAGLTCATKTVRLRGQTPSHGKLEGRGTVRPTGCPS